MRRAGGRLSVAESLCRPGQLESLGMAETNSASMAKAEREIKRLKLENQKLKTDLQDIRSLYNQLMQENTHERFDERRVTVLKSQVIQLERQVLLLNEALSSRAAVLLDIENGLTWLADKCRSYIGMDVRGPQVNVERSDLTLMVETAESARIKLFKQVENKTTERLSQPLKFYTEFVHPTRQDDLTLLEVASGSLEHLNLKHVTKLETSLSVLYRELVHLHQLMDENTTAESLCLWTSGHVITAARERLMTQMVKACALTKDCTGHLLDLSLLVPSAPWPPLKKSALKEVTAERVLGCLPSFPRSRSSESQQLIHALVKAYNYKVHMLNNKIHSLREDVKYHQKVYNLQLKYTESLFQDIREAYTAFEESSNEVIVKPLKGVLEAYVELNETASEKALKRFLSAFKDSAPQLNDIIETIGIKAFEESEGSKVLSQFGEEFFQSLEKVVKAHQCKRDKEASKLEDIRAEQAKLDRELQEILEDQENRVQEKLARLDITNDSETSKCDIENSGNKLTNRDDSPSLAGRESSALCQEKTVRNLSPNKAKVKKIHKKDWVDVFDPGEQVHNENESEDMTDQALLEHQNNNEKEEKEFLDKLELKDTKQSNIDSTTEPKQSDKPPLKTKTKKKLNYVPNTFVPNRTLQLRRSGSLTRLSAAENAEDRLDVVTVKETGNNKVETSNSARERLARSSSRERQVQPQPRKSRPAFR